MIMRSMGREVDFEARSEAERAPLMAWMEARRREKDRRHLSQLIVAHLLSQLRLYA